MVFLAITPEGLAKALEAVNGVDCHIWCDSNAASESDGANKKISRFNYPLIGVDRDIIEDALETIREHHPDQIIWIESYTV